MREGKRTIVPVALAAIAGTAAFAWAIAGRSGEPGEPVASAAPLPVVEIIAPKPPDELPHDDQEPEEECKNGCSLQTHHIPPLTDDQFLAALEAYAKEPPDQDSEALDTLLFYNARTIELIETHGTGKLPPAHAAFLRKELARDDADVWVRFVDEADKVRVAVGPIRVPIGKKKHLHPHLLDDVQSMEINGTVMRTGLYHLWSRY